MVSPIGWRARFSDIAYIAISIGKKVIFFVPKKKKSYILLEKEHIHMLDFKSLEYKGMMVVYSNELHMWCMHA